MSTGLYESVARIARHEAFARAIASAGRVTDVFASDGTPPDHAVTVELRESGLVLPRVPVAVGAMGFAAPPAVDDLVVVVFLEGDPNAPVVVGRLYHPDENPPTEAKPGKLALQLPSRQAQTKLDVVVDGDKPSIELTIPEDVKVQLLEDKALIQVGDMRVSVETGGGGRAEIAAGGSTITLKKDGDVSVKAAGKLKLEGQEVEISGSAKVKVQGAQVEIN